MDAAACHECGATWTRKGPDGCCAWAAGCEHRAMQTRVDDAAFDADYQFHFVPLDCGHTQAEHVQQWRGIAEQQRPFEVPPMIQDFLDRFSEPEGPITLPDGTKLIPGPIDGGWTDGEGNGGTFHIPGWDDPT